MASSQARRVPLDKLALGEWAPQRLIASHWSSLDADQVLWLKNPTPTRSMTFEPHTMPTMATSSLDALLSVAPQASAGRLAATVFHIGKCGSTVFQNMLDAHPRILGVVEPEIFLQIMCGLLGGTRYTEHDRDRWLAAAMVAFVNLMRPPDRHLVVKFTSLCFVALEHVRRLFPDAPVFIVCREPKSLIAAHLRSPVVWGGLRSQQPSIPVDRLPEFEHLCARMYGMSCETARTLEEPEFVARTIGHYYQRILDLDDDRVIPIHYETMKDPERLRAVLQLCGVEDADDAALAPMLDAARYYTKDFTQRAIYTGDRPVAMDAATLDGLVKHHVRAYEPLLARSARLLGRTATTARSGLIG